MDILTLYVSHKHANTQVLSYHLNCSSFDKKPRVQSPSKLCSNLHKHHDESSIPSDVPNLKSFITFHVFCRTYPCRYSKFSWQCQLSLYLIHSVYFHSQIITLSFYEHVGYGPLHPLYTAWQNSVISRTAPGVDWNPGNVSVCGLMQVFIGVIKLALGSGTCEWYGRVQRTKLDRMVQSGHILPTFNCHEQGVGRSIKLSSLS